MTSRIIVMDEPAVGLGVGGEARGAGTDHETPWSGACGSAYDAV